MQPFILGLSLIDLAVVAGVALVVPQGLGGSRRVWFLVATCVALSCTLEVGTIGAVALALTWAAWGVVVIGRVVLAAGPPTRRADRRGDPAERALSEAPAEENLLSGSVLCAQVPITWSRPTVIRVVVGGYSLVAATWFALSRMGVAPLGIHEPIVELTAVHFTYVGVGALVLAEAAADHARGASKRWLGPAALGLTAGAPPVVALGFVTGVGVAQVGGAVLMSLGVFATAALQLIEARRVERGSTRVLLAVSGLAVWAPMVLAVAWAAGQHWDVPALGVPDMVRTHGSLNALGFIGAGLLARRRPRSPTDARGPEVPTATDGAVIAEPRPVAP